GGIPFELGNLNGLEILELGGNKLSGLIPSAIFNISSMKKMGFSNNKLLGNLPPTLGSQLPYLECLSVWGNSLNETIPPSISNASKLYHIELVDNEFSGRALNAIGNLRMLEELHIFNNPNLGNIPDEIGNLSHLIGFDLSFNRLTGTIPQVVHKMKKLQLLYLYDNELHGAILDQLCELQALSELYMDNNNLSQQIPKCFSNLTSLRRLSLEFTRLESEIPSSFWDLTYLFGFSLAGNDLIGSLPQQVGNFKGLVFLDLSGNQLSGDIPVSIGGLLDLQDLSFAKNHFQGHIPKSMGNLVSLETLDLSANNLTGVIPKSMESLRYLQFLNLSQNRLQGEIPNGGTFANLSSDSFELNAGLCGLPKFGVPSCPEPIRENLKHIKYFGKLHIVVLKVILPLVIVASFALFMVIVGRKKKSKKVKEEPLPSFIWRMISLLDLQRATNGFDSCNLLGRRSFGQVYKGELADGTNVAVKVFDDFEGEVDDVTTSNTECEVMRNLRHRNLIKIISTCYTTGFKALVLEFMPNDSLQKWLYSHNYFLDIFQRLDIVIDVASALEYLHHGYSVPVVHCDLKPSNVLLDEDLVAHLSDFGISKLLGDGASMMRTLTLATIGYMAPEFGMEGIVSTKSDVYSFGVLVMEVFTRRNPTEGSFQAETSMK
ncbi:unnamed protein product, partial [Linum tenue]